MRRSLMAAALLAALSGFGDGDRLPPRYVVTLHHPDGVVQEWWTRAFARNYASDEFVDMATGRTVLVPVTAVVTEE